MKRPCKFPTEKLIVFLIMLGAQKMLVAQDQYSWDFTGCEIKDILFSISLDTGISIVPDDTVFGTGNFQFSGGDFNLAFDSFLKSNRLYVNKSEKLWTVSRFQIKSENNLYELNVYDLYPCDIIEKISENVPFVITYDSLPAYKISLHFKGVSEKELVKNLSKSFGDYEILEENSCYHFRKIQQNQFEDVYEENINISVIYDSASDLNSDLNSDFSSDFSSDSDALFGGACPKFLVDIKKGTFFKVVENLFNKSKEEGLNWNFCILSDNDCEIQRTVFLGNNFDDTINKLCSQNGYKAIKTDDIYYIVLYDKSKSDLIYGEKNWYRFSLNYTGTDILIPLLTKKIGNLDIIPLPDNSSFLCNCSEAEKIIINQFIKDVDIKLQVYLVNLKYLKPQELIEYLPPNIDKNKLFFADNNSCLYFRGTEEAYKNLVQQIEVIDKPVQRLSYDLLILQYDETCLNTWASSIGIKRLKTGDRSCGTAMLGSVMGFNLNVVAAFGLNFAAELQASIEENHTNVFADTTLHGVPGKKITFQNTNTYRYRDNNVNPETGEPIYSGITKEIITGIKIDVQGWVSGDGLITSTVTASISRQGNESSGASGNPPPTSEKLVTTEVTGKSGEPVILSGLLLSASSESEKRSPGISKIPLIGNLFKNKSKNEEKSQMVIYLVPHIEGENSVAQEECSQEWIENRIESLTNKI